MAGNSDPQRRPVVYDLRNQRFLADPLIGSKYYPIPSNNLNADATIDLINTATSSVIAAARVTAASTSGAGVVQLSDSVSSSSAGTAATSLAVKTAYDLAAAALEPGDIGVTVQGYDADTAKTDVVQSFTAAQRGTIVALGAVSAGTTTLDFAAGNHFSFVLPAGGSVTLANPTNLTAGQSGCVVITQNSGTAATVAYGSAWTFVGGAPSVSTSLSSVNVIAYFVESGSRITAQLLANPTA
jgi:hypothetical protein